MTSTGRCPGHVASQVIALHSGDWEVEVRPEIGGAITALRWRGADVFRPTPPGTTEPLQTACFPLAPYCNRIRAGRFRFAGRDIAMPPNFAPEPHSLHGLSWQRAWTLESTTASDCTLADDYDRTGSWPWAYRAEQRVRLTPEGCAITLVLTNRSYLPMPAGIGLHPCFRRGPETVLRFEADHVLLSGADPLPTGISAPAEHFADFAAGARLPVETVDHCFAGWQGQAALEDSLGSISFSAEGAPHLHLYAPSDGGALCLEPVSHTPDAFNRAREEITVLPPGGAMSLNLRISAG